MPTWQNVQQQIFALLPVVRNTAGLYLFIILALRIFGRRQRAELSITELVVIMVIGSSVETSMVNGNVSLLAGLTASATLFITNRLLSFALLHSHFLKRVFVGHPTPLVYDGKYLSSRMRRIGLTEGDVMEGIRERGYDDLNDIHMAIFEIDGTISVIPKRNSNTKQAGSPPKENNQ